MMASGIERLLNSQNPIYFFFCVFFFFTNLMNLISSVPAYSGRCLLLGCLFIQTMELFHSLLFTLFILVAYSQSLQTAACCQGSRRHLPHVTQSHEISITFTSNDDYTGSPVLPHYEVEATMNSLDICEPCHGVYM